MEIPKEVIIDRAKWRLGGDSVILVQAHGRSCLLTLDGCYCATGFYAKACGVSDEHLVDTSTIYSLRTFRNIHVPGDAGFLSAAMEVNDQPLGAQTPLSKEGALQDLFSENGIDLKFEGEYDLYIEREMRETRYDHGDPE